MKIEDLLRKGNKSREKSEVVTWGYVVPMVETITSFDGPNTMILAERKRYVHFTVIVTRK